MADTNVAIKLYKTSATSKCVGINVTNSIDTTGYALYVNGNTNISGDLTLTGSITGNTPASNITGVLGIAHGGTGKTTAADAWTALGGGASGKHADSYFALASHTHSYAGSSSVGGAATSANVLNVIDERSAAMTIDKPKKIEAFFSNNGMPNSNWWAGIHVTGWQGAYSSWELVGPAHNTDQRTQPLYIRSSKTNSAWGSWRQVYDSSNPPTAAAVGAATSSHTHTYANITDAGTHVYDATISRTKNTVLAAPNGSNGTASFRALVLADLPTGTTSSTVAIGNHTHSYAGSSSAGGAATSANKLNTNAGSAINPVYFSSGVPVACTTLTSLATGKGYGFADFTLSGAATSYKYLIMFGYVVSGAARVSTIIPIDQISTTERLFQIADYNNSYRSVGIKKSGNDIIFSSANGYAKSGSSFDVYGGI